MEAVDYRKNVESCMKAENKYSTAYFSLLPVCGKKYVIDWCMNEGLIAKRYECPVCARDMKLSKTAKASDGYEWRCRFQGKVNAHDVSRSVRSGTWFALSRMPLIKCLKVTREWFGRCEQKFVMEDVNVAKKTVNDWYSFCREVCQTVLLEESVRIGGVGAIVEIDESKFGKMKYGRGRRVKGNWVFGGIERGTNKCFFRVVPKRGKDELLPVIEEWVLPGTTIISDCWRAYDCLEDEGFQHLKVNHSLHYVNPETGAHTNTIEAVWSAIKRMLRNTPHKDDMFDSYLFEYVWRKQHGHSMKDHVFRKFLDDVIKVYPPRQQDLAPEEAADYAPPDDADTEDAAAGETADAEVP